ncbi:MAG: calcium/sodium antiporter [Bacteroidales bacterium]|jgi:cation:H+ antiporter|nr:calcium/sodium antiporter [Bacteroidales bacterium]
MIDVLILMGGLLLLVFSGDWLVRGGASLAKRFKVSPLVIGVTIISLGTSAPELVVSLQAAVTGHPAISIGNVLGSNIANIALVLGVTALIIVIPVRRKTILFDWSVMMFAALLFFIFASDFTLSLWEGIILIVFLVAYVLYSLISSRQAMKSAVPEIPPFSLGLSIGIVVISILGLVLGSHFLVEGASNIAYELGVSERVISISIIAFGTSVPELATSVMAARRKELDISVGNLIGSNIFNIFGILGITAIVTDIPVSKESLNIDWFWMVGIFLLLFVFMQPIKNSRIRWWHGLIFLLIYIAYYYMIYFM